ncbi:alpha/beta hydrolase family protein [Gordonia sp. SCSIO 19800]|uniref:alpha/beta hydrolase n=1 Tax=Gordonia sp. SCSIO 19800 TaxID=2826926 RepID=UPI001B841820|nr:alpha/beta hydrolase family protein [Gordonia sp. SCSIO 19800]MBR7191169.1 esterase family protein [Gordonia sp. SCSIO 19800]
MALLALAISCVAAPVYAEAAPIGSSSVVSRVVDVDDPRQTKLHVYSASMKRAITVSVRTPRDTSSPSPTLYLLNGAAGEDSPTSRARAAYNAYFADRKVFVVTPLEGEHSYYTDWIHTDPKLGVAKWQTFLTKELPPLIDDEFDTTGNNAAAGISMSGTSVFNLAIAAPGLYRAIGAYSGCARTSDPLGQRYVRIVVEGRGGADARNMWGPFDRAGWRANDPYLNAHKLGNTKVYMTTGTGRPGAHDRLDDELINGNAIRLGDQAVIGGVVEAAVDTCTRQMAQRLRELGVPTTTILRPTGTHSWGYWQDDVRRTWPMIERDLQ